MKQKIQDILKKINYIEADIDIQKQILHSIPSQDKQEIERVLVLIAGKKKEITTLRQEIQRISPEEYDKIIQLEHAVGIFQKIASERKFKFIQGMSTNEGCHLSISDNSRIPCLVKACDEKGEWIIITLDGQIKEFHADEVTEQGDV